MGHNYCWMSRWRSRSQFKLGNLFDESEYPIFSTCRLTPTLDQLWALSVSHICLSYVYIRHSLKPERLTFIYELEENISSFLFRIEWCFNQWLCRLKSKLKWKLKCFVTVFISAPIGGHKSVLIIHLNSTQYSIKSSHFRKKTEIWNLLFLQVSILC